MPSINTKVIKNVIFVSPDLKNKKLEKVIRNRYNKILKMTDKVAELSMQAMKMKQELDILEKEFNNLTRGVCTLEFETREFREIKNDISMVIKTPTDYRNTNI